MKRCFIVLQLLSCLTIFPIIAAAQDTPTQSVDLGDSYTITVPAEWEVTRLHAGAFRLGDDAIKLNVTTPTRLNTLNVNFPEDTNVVDVLVTLVFPFEGVDLEPASVQKTRYDNRQTAVYINSTDADIDRLYAAVTLSDGNFGYLSFSGAKDDFAAFSPQIDDIIASFDSDTVITENRPLTGTACIVSTDAANAAQLRVGPGTNRGAISFLPANTDVTVTGRIELDDGSIWYQLDKTEAAPNGTAAAELWVTADDVTASGDCEHVGDTSAPPIIPIAVAPATVQPGENPPPQPVQSGALPASGGWILTMNPITNASCLGGDNFRFNSSEVFDPTTYGDTLVIIDGGSFNYGGDVFRRIGSSNSFAGTFTYSDGTIGQVRFDMLSSAQMSGQIIANFIIEGTQCSATVQFISNHG